MTKSIKLPASITEFKSALKKGIEAYSESPVKNKNKLNECTAIALNLYNQDTLSAVKIITPNLNPFVATINSFDEVVINGVIIDDELFEEEVLKYVLRDRNEIIDDIFDYLPGQNKINSELIRENIKFLATLKDEFIFISIEDNSYIERSSEPEKFDKQCEISLIAHYKNKNDWKGLISLLNKKYFSDTVLDDNEYYLDDVVLNTTELLEKLDINDFISFLNDPNYNYLIEKIKCIRPLQYDCILLICFLIKKRRYKLVSVWDFDTTLIKSVMTLMGYSTEPYYG